MHRRPFTALVPVLAVAAHAWAPAPVVQTTYGRVLGSLEPSGVARYLGVPFAAPPVGSRRFAAPVPPAPWVDVLNASTLPPICPQFAGNGDVTPLPESEDCLYLRITVPPPRNGAPLPVLAYVHGGTNVAGGFSGTESTSDWSRATGAIIVEIPYRLGVLGFFASPLNDTSWAPNAALRDAALALHWVRDNAAAFGGDAARVTLCGESSGAGDIMALLVSPLAAGTFAAFAWHSGVAMSLQPALAVATTSAFAADERVNCTGPPAAVLACMRSATVASLQSASAPSPNLPMIDGAVLPGSMLRLVRDGHFPRNVSFLTLLNAHEGDSFVACDDPPACTTSEAQYNGTIAGFAASLGANATFVALLHAAYDARVASLGRFGTLSAIVTDLFSCSGRALAAAGAAFGLRSFRVNQSQALYTDQVGSARSLLNRSTHVHDLWLLYNASFAPGVPAPFVLDDFQSAVRDDMHAWWGNFFESGDPNVGSRTPAIEWPQWRARAGEAVLVTAAPPSVVSSIEWDAECEALWLPWLLEGAPVSPPQDAPRTRRPPSPGFDSRGLW